MNALQSRISSMEAQMAALSQVAIETAAAVETAVQEPVEVVDDTETEQKPAPATEPKKRKRSWA